MSLESILERIASALEGKTVPAVAPEQPATPAATGKKKAAPVVKEPPPETDEDEDFLGGDEPESVTYTVDNVRDALVKYRGTYGKDPAQKLLKVHGDVTTLQDLKPEKYAAVIAAATAPKK